jgi:plastocyanin
VGPYCHPYLLPDASVTRIARGCKRGTSDANTDHRHGHRTTTDQPVWKRRPVLKLLGVGAGLSVGSGAVAAQYGTPTEETPTDGTTTDGLDPYYGVATPDASDIPEGIDPDHEVALNAVLPENMAEPQQPPYFYYEPTGLAVEPGDVVQFTGVTAYHPGHGFQRRVPEGVPPFSSPVLSAGGAWFYAFDEPGVYDVYCGPHHVLGMVMRIVVGDTEETPAYVGTFEGREPSAEQPPLFAPFSQAFLEQELNALSDANEDCEWPWLTPVEVLSAPALDPANVRQAGTVPFEDVLADIARFGESETPTEPQG